MNRQDFEFDTEDDPYRKCEICDIKYHEGFGRSCDSCDIWVCNNCWPEHEEEHDLND